MNLSPGAKLLEKRPIIFYGWAIVAVACVSMFFIFGLRYSFSVFYVAILNEFGWSRGETALVFSLHVVAYGATSPICGLLADRFGPRKIMPIGALLIAVSASLLIFTTAIWQLLLLYGVLVAVGSCLAGWIPYSLMVSRWFVKRRGLALAIASAGFGSSFFMAPVAESLTANLGWRGAFLVLAACVFFIVFPLEFFFVRQDPADMGLQPDGLPKRAIDSEALAAQRDESIVDKDWASKTWTLGKAVRTRRFWLQYCAAFCFWGIGQSLILSHQVAFTVDIGFSSMFGALIFSMYGLFYVSGNLLGSLSDRVGREVAVTVGVAFAVLGMLMLLVANYISQQGFLYAYAIFFGLGMGICSPTFVAIAADVFPGKHFGAIYGVIGTAFGIAGAFSPWLGGWIHDATGSYAWAFVITSMAALVSVPLIWMVAPRKVRRRPGT